MATENSFAGFVSLACHDLRTPLATVSGFAHTLQRTDELGEPARPVRRDDPGGVRADRGAPGASSGSSLGSRPATTRRVSWRRTRSSSPGRRRPGSARRRRPPVPGRAVRVDRDAVERGLAGLALCALRHGGLERVELTADGPSVWIEPVIPSAAPIVLGDDLKDLASRSRQARRGGARRRARARRRTPSSPSAYVAGAALTAGGARGGGP